MFAFVGNEAVFWWRTLGGIATVFVISVTFFAYKPEETMQVGTVPTAACRRFGESEKERVFCAIRITAEATFSELFLTYVPGLSFQLFFRYMAGPFQRLFGDLGSPCHSLHDGGGFFHVCLLDG